MKFVPKLQILFSITVLIIAASCSQVATSFELKSSEDLLPTNTIELISPTQTSDGFQSRFQTTPSASPTIQPPTPEIPIPVVQIPNPSPTLCPPELCTHANQFFLARPIAPTENDNVDPTYRFGTTLGQKRDPHHGVEFLNPGGTQVLAAADGEVIVAGDDLETLSERGEWPLIFYGPYSYFYGNLVVIQHQVPEELLKLIPDYPQPFYTLYAHLSEISVEVGDKVQKGDEIGKVGHTGVAIGNHLHFEVRIGENRYPNSRNPELWLAPHLDEYGQPHGGIAGRVIDKYGNNIPVTGIVIMRVNGGSNDREHYLISYEEKSLIGQPPWEESFMIGDLPVGTYRITFPLNGMQEHFVDVLPGQFTMVTFYEE
jgi:murein DD-endopeptidase MepM/ murein hydrolase activator NlpD